MTRAAVDRLYRRMRPLRVIEKIDPTVQIWPGDVMRQREDELARKRQAAEDWMDASPRARLERFKLRDRMVRRKVEAIEICAREFAQALRAARGGRSAEVIDLDTRRRGRR